MRWIALLRFFLVFAWLYFVLPALLKGRTPRHRWHLVAIESFAVITCSLQIAITILGLARLALPGTTAIVYVVVMVCLGRSALRRTLVGSNGALQIGERLFDLARQWQAGSRQRVFH